MLRMLVPSLLRLPSLLTLLCVALASTSPANAFSNLYAFGDSLTDSGKILGLNPSLCPPAPYVGCRFSNGPVWVENLAADLGLSATPDSLGGTNYALGGATANEIFGQVQDFGVDVGGVADPDALYIVWGGGNDFLQGLDPMDAAAEIVNSVVALAGLGASNFLVNNLPVLDPMFGVPFNIALANGLAGLTGLNIFEFDVLNLLTSIFISPGAFGLSNVSTPCFDGTTVCADPDAYLFWDDVHPTAAGHRLISEAAFAIIPEPGTGLLLGIGLVALSGQRRRVACGS